MEANHRGGTDIFYKSVPESGAYNGRTSVRVSVDKLINAYNESMKYNDSVVTVESDKKLDGMFD